MRNNNSLNDNAVAHGPKEAVECIVLLTPHTGRNLGDAAIQNAAIENIRLRYPSASISGITLQPQATAELHGIPCFPLTSAHIGQYGTSGEKKTDKRQPKAEQSNLRKNKYIRFLFRAALIGPRFAIRIVFSVKNEIKHLFKGFAFIRGADQAVFSGGGQLDDHWGGPWHHPYTILKWAVLARIAGARLIFLSVGADHLHSPLTRFFLRRALSLAHYTSYRDDETRTRMTAMGVKGDGRVCPDLAYGLPATKYGADRSDGSKTRLIVGVSPISASARTPRNGAPDTYLENLTALVSWLLSENHVVLFFPSQTSSDPPVISQIRDRLEASGQKYKSEQIISETVQNVDSLLTQIARTDVIVASRFHSVLLAHVLSRPVLALSYRSKVNNLMTAIGLPQYCLDIHDMNLDVLKERLTSLIETRRAVAAQISVRVAEFRRLLEQQYDHVFGKIDRPAASGPAAEQAQVESDIVSGRSDAN